MSGTYPTSPVFSAIDFRSKWYNVTSESLSGRTQARHLGGHRWEFSCKYPTMTRSDFQTVDAFIEAQQGTKETFQIVLPVVCEQSGTATGSAQVNGAHSIGDTTIALDGYTGTLKAGDVLKFANHTKVYKLTADQSGPGTVSIMPPLVAALVDNEGVTYDDVPITARLANSVQEFGVGLASFYTFEVDMVEAP